MRRGPGRFLVSWWPWRAWAFVVSGAAVGAVVLVSVGVLLVLGSVLLVVGVGLVVLAAAGVAGVPFAAFERRRLRIVEPVPPADPHRSVRGAGTLRWLRIRLAERATWREFGYLLLHCLVFTPSGGGFVALLGLSVVLLVAPLVLWGISPDTIMLIPGRSIADPVDALPASAVGLLGLVLCAYAGGLLAAAQVWAAQLLLGVGSEDLGVRVVELTRSRARLVDAFEAERRRIERDLHDGAQQQLVALSMTLGLAELELRGQDSPAAELVARARGEARRALDQLRALVRGIHPQVLTDHGLPAAVEELAQHQPIPVAVAMDLPGRLPAPVETAAYFTVTEALANAAKHSGARQLAIEARMEDETLVLTVTDDGRGGADPAAGTGLQGLADRVAVLDGRLVVSSPVGGPTRLWLEVPC